MPQQLSYPFCLDCAIAIRLFTHSQLHNYPNKIISPGALAEITRHVALGYTLHSRQMPRLVESHTVLEYTPHLGKMPRLVEWKVLRENPCLLWGNFKPVKLSRLSSQRQLRIKLLQSPLFRIGGKRSGCTITSEKFYIFL